ncbi:hypothetical protein DACRYDRAFT_111169 [Dacryopinax primogenitus]|uniref:Uncharacterized protein n=1 Tax=Dacryopinax primogenitus (strain DJM 731) TaxID=1858805 RepID=M5FSM3_DACPD|nr:uncharacterized protein DACRYDRAFT_111169 [Dacryopinax primogenitus]EJT98194.1 hypothetical protein DACRYDRAFT_111169 [Dacryopinax primogenitus]
MSSQETKPLQPVNPAKLQNLREKTEAKYRMTMEAFYRNTGKEHPLAGKLREGGEEQEGEKGEAQAGEEPKAQEQEVKEGQTKEKGQSQHS